MNQPPAPLHSHTELPRSDLFAPPVVVGFHVHPAPSLCKKDWQRGGPMAQQKPALRRTPPRRCRVLIGAETEGRGLVETLNAVIAWGWDAELSPSECWILEPKERFVTSAPDELSLRDPPADTLWREVYFTETPGTEGNLRGWWSFTVSYVCYTDAVEKVTADDVTTTPTRSSRNVCGLSEGVRESCITALSWWRVSHGQ